MSKLQVTAVPAFDDNYFWLIHSPRLHEQVVVVDPGDAELVLATLQRRSLKLGAILITHHHADHTGGIEALLAHDPVPIYAPAQEQIPGNPRPVRQGQSVNLEALGLAFEVFDTPGHTVGHIVYYGHGTVFCGDTLFSAGCGRLFEGTAEQMSQSLRCLSKLPGTTQVYCGHEYTLANLRFALTVEPDNQNTRAHLELCQSLRRGGLPTLPSNIELELKINPFLRLGAETVKRAVAHHAGHRLDSESEIFAVLRDWKDHFRP